MVMVSTHGRMVECMKETMSMTRKVVSESTHGPTVDNTMACGKMENRTVRVSTSCLRVYKDAANGEMVYVRNGSMQQVK